MNISNKDQELVNSEHGLHIKAKQLKIESIYLKSLINLKKITKVIKLLGPIFGEDGKLYQKQ